MHALPGMALDARLKAELTGLLEDELALSGSLLECMQSEQLCLAHYDHSGFADQNHRKSIVLGSLRELEDKRRTLFRQLQAADFATGTHTFEQWQDNCLQDPTTAPLVQNLRRVAAACTQQNQQLGRLISRQTRFFDFLVKQLLPGRGDGLTYQRSGETHAAGNMRTLASA